MKINRAKFEATIKTAKAKTNDRRWLNAIDRAAEGLTSGAWIATELANCLAVTTESGETYFANGTCQCKAYHNGMACKHRAAARLVEIYNATPEPTPAREPRIVRSIEGNYGHKYVEVVRCDGWMI